ncbi:MAG: hypothetical protein QG653_175 [Patescibacteria group bacterium]|nr:hypothetical protein [Patescibacteria group bacterium]
MKKIKIAFIKYGGLTSGGSEKLLQIIAANLPKDLFDVDYFYCDPTEYVGAQAPDIKTDSHRIEYMKKHGVNLVRFIVSAKDVTTPYHTWLGTNFWEVFDQKKYDVIQTCRAGHKEYPFCNIKNIPIVDIIALSSGADNQYNIARVVHLSKWSADGWVKRGGDEYRITFGSLPIAIGKEREEVKDIRGEYKLEGKFIFGMHQRSNNDIFSDIPLAAYKQIENENTMFILLGGGNLYKDQAKKLSIKNILFLESTGDSEKVFSFLKTLNVYSHGRADGEINSQAIAEALFFGLPVVSHYSKQNNGHVEGIGDAGRVVSGIEEYAKELSRLMRNAEYYKLKSNNAIRNFNENYELSRQIEKYTQMYRDVVANPYPNKIPRLLSSLHYTQNLRVLAVFVYLKFKYYFLNKR